MEKYYCNDCGVEMNEGEAKTFTCCDACWDKKYPAESNQVQAKVKPEIVDIEKIIEYAFKKGEDWGITYGGWFIPDEYKQKKKLRAVILDTKENFNL